MDKIIKNGIIVNDGESRRGTIKIKGNTIEKIAYLWGYKDENEYLSYLQHIKNTALYETGVEVNATSQVVSLSTCTNVSDTQRLLVHGVKIGEKVVGE